MSIIDSQNYKQKKFVDSRIKFCVECGSTKVAVYGRYLVCSDCKTIRHFKVRPVRFQRGDFVRIIEEGKRADIVYEIAKVKKSKAGVVSYILKGKSRIEIPYYEGSNSHLEKVETTRVSQKKKAQKLQK